MPASYAACVAYQRGTGGWQRFGEQTVYDNRWVRLGLVDVGAPNGERWTEIDQRSSKETVCASQWWWLGTGSNRRPSDFQFKVHLVGVVLPGTSRSLPLQVGYQEYFVDHNYWTVRWTHPQPANPMCAGFGDGPAGVTLFLLNRPRPGCRPGPDPGPGEHRDQVALAGPG